MTAASYIDLNINAAEQFKESVSEPAPNTNIYLTFGKIDPWSNDANPPMANSCTCTVYDIWRNLVGGKRIVASDVAHVIPKINWTSNTVYDAFDSKRTDLFDANTKMCVLTSEWNVYKCIANNYGGESTIEPSSTNPAIITSTPDGYYWKYMYTISDNDQVRFTTDSYIPVKTLYADDGSSQWLVQNNAIKGAIASIIIENGGENYTDANTITLSISGDGSGASAYATINNISNTVNSIIMIDYGTQYTYANVSITDSAGGTGANARAIISPPGGHGSNPLYELGGRNLLINARLKYDENGSLPVTNDFRQISLMKDPLLKGTNTPCVNTTFLQAMTITTIGSGDYQDDEWVYQGSSFNNSTFRGQVLSWNGTTGKVLLINTKGSPTGSQSLIGQQTTTIRIVSSVEDEELERHTGRIMYVDNIKPITRSSDQIEDFKILIKF